MLDQPTGLPRVEMTFAVDPSLQQTSVAAAPPVLTDLVTTASAVVSETTSSVSQSDRPEVRYRQTASVGGSSEPPVQAVGTTQAAAAPPHHDDVDVAAGTEASARAAEDGDGSRRLLAAVMSTLSWNNDTRRDPLIIFIVVALLFVLMGHDDTPSPLTLLSLLGCALCLLQLMLLQSSFNKCIAKFLKLYESHDGEKQLEELRTQLVTVWGDVKALRRDHPTAFTLAIIVGLGLLACIDQLFGGLFALFLLALALALTPGLVNHKCVNKVCVQCANVKNRLLKKSQQRDAQD